MALKIEEKIMKKILFAILVCFGISKGYCIESRIVDGKPEFAVSKVNGVVCWTPQEQADLETAFNQFSATSSVTVQMLTPSTLEDFIFQSGLKFKNKSELDDCVNNKQALDDKIMDLLPSEYSKKSAEIDALKMESDKR